MPSKLLVTPSALAVFLGAVPVTNRVLIEPDGETASLFQASVILGLVTDAVTHGPGVFGWTQTLTHYLSVTLNQCNNAAQNRDLLRPPVPLLCRIENADSPSCS